LSAVGRLRRSCEVEVSFLSGGISLLGTALVK
jgi:hypothetical protein